MRAILLILLGLIISLYIPLNHQVPRYNFKTRLDRHIPLWPWTVWIYSSYYLLFPLSIALTWNSRYSVPLLITQIIATTIASVIWKIFPNGVIRPQIEITYNQNHRFLNLIYTHDKDCNGLPSSHVLHTFIACFFLAKLFPQIWIIFFVILLAISFSTLTTKQHYFLDMASTLIITPFIIELASKVI